MSIDWCVKLGEPWKSKVWIRISDTNNSKCQQRKASIKETIITQYENKLHAYLMLNESLSYLNIPLLRYTCL